MAIVFSLPWALLMWSCVKSCSPTFFLWKTDTPDSMLMFYTGLLCYCWSIPKQGSRIAIALVSGVLFAFLWACVWTIWESSDKWAVWLDGLPSPIARALRALHLSRFRQAAMLFRKCFLSYPTNNVGSEHELPTSNHPDGVVAGDA